MTEENDMEDCYSTNRMKIAVYRMMQQVRRLWLPIVGASLSPKHFRVWCHSSEVLCNQLSLVMKRSNCSDETAITQEDSAVAWISGEKVRTFCHMCVELCRLCSWCEEYEEESEEQVDKEEDEMEGTDEM